jgi:hypothetical protein
VLATSNGGSSVTHYLYYNDGTREAIGENEVEASNWLTEQGYGLEEIMDLLMLEMIKEESQ